MILIKRLLIYVAKLCIYIGKAFYGLKILLYRPLFGKHGKNFYFDPDGLYSFRNIFVGDDVSLGYRSVIIAALSKIIIGNKVMFGPHVSIIGGNHNTAKLCEFMYDVKEKRPEDDLDIIIQDDVWIGSNVTILHGLIIGRGSIVGAGSVITKDILPYSVVAGVPAKVIRFRWTLDEALTHEMNLYPPEQRLLPSQLKHLTQISQRE